MTVTEIELLHDEIDDGRYYGSDTEESDAEEHDESDVDEYEDTEDVHIYYFSWTIFNIESDSPHSEVKRILKSTDDHLLDKVTVSVNAHKTDKSTADSSGFVMAIEMTYEDPNPPPYSIAAANIEKHDKITYKDVHYLDKDEPQEVTDNDSDTACYVYKMKYEWSGEEWLDLLQNKSLVADPSDGSIKMACYIVFNS